MWQVRSLDIDLSINEQNKVKCFDSQCVDFNRCPLLSLTDITLVSISVSSNSICVPFYFTISWLIKNQIGKQEILSAPIFQIGKKILKCNEIRMIFEKSPTRNRAWNLTVLRWLWVLPKWRRFSWAIRKINFYSIVSNFISDRTSSIRQMASIPARTNLSKPIEFRIFWIKPVLQIDSTATKIVTGTWRGLRFCRWTVTWNMFCAKFEASKNSFSSILPPSWRRLKANTFRTIFA